MGFVFTLFCNCPTWAAAAVAAGIDRVGCDLEKRGKHLRQDVRHSRLSDHSLADQAAIAAVTPPPARFARVNPWHAASGDEIEALLALGTSTLMLPYFHQVEDAAAFAAAVAGRARIVLLVETAAALERIDAVLALCRDGGEIHFGLNDLHLSLGHPSHFTVLLDRRFTAACAAAAAAGVPFGIAAVARPHDQGLPVPADLLYAEYVRLGATRTLISRSFLAGLAPSDLPAMVAAARALLAAQDGGGLAGNGERLHSALRRQGWL